MPDLLGIPYILYNRGLDSAGFGTNNCNSGEVHAHIWFLLLVTVFASSAGSRCSYSGDFTVFPVVCVGLRKSLWDAPWDFWFLV